MKNYSQNNEQKVILEYFGDYVGTFLDFGANDGITLSNTYALELLGWTGICVEPVYECYKKLLKSRPNSECLNCCVGTESGDVEIEVSDEHLGTGDYGLLSTMYPEEKKRWGNTQKFVKQLAFVYTPSQIIQDKKFDFITIDIEGGDLDVLKLIDLNEVGCRLLCVEYNGKDKEKFDDVVLPQGYKLIHQNFENLIYGK